MASETSIFLPKPAMRTRYIASLQVKHRLISVMPRRPLTCFFAYLIYKQDKES